PVRFGVPAVRCIAWWRCGARRQPIRFDPPQNEEIPMSKMRTPLILSTALASALLASTAFAQDAAQQKQSAPPQDTTQSQPPANAAGDQQKKSWSDLDTDRNGSLSAGEAAALDSMAQIF